MTSKKFDITKEIINRIHHLHENFKNVDIDVSAIDKNLQMLMQGHGIKLLNSIDELSSGYFLFYNTNGFFVVHDDKGLAKHKQISDEYAFDILSLYYSCRILSRIPKYYNEEIISRIKLLLDKIQE
jgi:hypothetical protein